jgi:thioredoxin-related protein
MNWNWFIRSLLLSVIVFLFSGLTLAQQPAFYQGSYDDLLLEAKSQNKSYVLYFTTPTCSPCKRMKAETWTNPELVSLMRQKVFVYEADVELFDALAAAQQYEVSVFPTMIFFTPKGKVIGKLFGFQSARKLVSLIVRHT